jgi:hypothetical protein
MGGLTGLVVGKSPGSEEFVLFTFPRENPNALFDFVFVRPLGVEGDGGFGFGEVAPAGESG